MWNFIRRALGAALLASAAAGATAQPLTIKLGWATSDGATDPLAVTARSFKQAVEKRSSGGIQVQLYPNRQLQTTGPEAAEVMVWVGRRAEDERRAYDAL